MISIGIWRGKLLSIFRYGSDMNRLAYIRAMTLILSLIKDKKIKLSWKDGHRNNYFLNSHRHPENNLPAIISINKNLKRTDIIISLLHELGHYQDYCKNKRLFNRFHKAIGLLEKNPKNVKLQRVIARGEVRAWKEAELLRQKLRIKLKTRFNVLKKECLDSY